MQLPPDQDVHSSEFDAGLDLPIEVYSGFGTDRENLPNDAQRQLATLLKQLAFNPDDPGLMAACTIKRPFPWAGRIFAYRIGDGYAVYWKIVRTRAGYRDYVTLAALRPIRVDLLDIRHVRL
jgi:hypothetical protein